MVGAWVTVTDSSIGVIPLEFMDLIVDPIRQELVGANGDEALLMAM